MIINCSNCQKEKYVIPSRRKEHNFCSRGCSAVYFYKTGIKTGAQMTAKAHQTLREKGHYKRDNSYLSDHRAPSKQLHARKKISEAKLKSNWMTGRTGELAPNFIGGKSYRGWNWRTVKNGAKTRDNNRCVKCGISERISFEKFGQPLQVDHIIPYKITRDSSLSNLQTLCCACHGAKWASDLILIKEHNVKIKENIC
jgi:hypothetical protein